MERLNVDATIMFDCTIVVFQFLHNRWKWANALYYSSYSCAEFNVGARFEATVFFVFTIFSGVVPACVTRLITEIR
jgi:hypothetical protein